MSATMRSTLIPTDRFSSSITVRETAKGGHLLQGLRIFKVGTFKDSMGFERTWEDVHLSQMEGHYRLLKDGGFLPDVPVRADHSFSVLNVVGYFDSVYRDPSDSMFLSADVEITEPEAYDKWKRGTWRSRSLEVGWYETNGGALYHPVILGLAFVDLPAVEGLFSNQRDKFHVYTLLDSDKENQMFTFNGQQFADQAACEAAINYAAHLETEAERQRTEDFNRACSYAAALDAHNENAQKLGVLGVTVLQAAPANHGGQHQTMATFTINGQPTQDQRAVQAHIATLETFRTETTKVNRDEFVDKLATDRKITAPQVEAYKAHVSIDTMTDEAFASFTKLWENAPAQSLLSTHSAGGGGGAPGGLGDLNDQIAVQSEIVDRLKASGMTDDKVQKTTAYQRLTELRQQASGQTA